VVSIGVLAGVAVVFTAYVVTVPVWALFIGWASYFAAGGGRSGFLKSLCAAAAGVVSAAFTLLVTSSVASNAWLVGLAVIFGAGVLVVLAEYDWSAYTPSAFLGFASTVAVGAATGHAIDDWSISNPALVTLSAFILGGGFGLICEMGTRVLSGRRQLGSENTSIVTE
jgi:hypothetical protein